MRHRGTPPRLETRHIDLPDQGLVRVALLSDTHSHPHPSLAQQLSRVAPAVALHAGDLGSEASLEPLRSVCPLVAVRGNVDPRRLPDHLHLQLHRGQSLVLSLLLTHIGLRRTRLLPEVRDLAAHLEVGLVVCGHSHVPFLGRDGQVAVFNPGSCGPRRWTLPITWGLLELGPEGAGLSHVDCETGETWLP